AAAGKKVVLSSKEVTLLTRALAAGDTLLQVGNTGSFKVDDVLHIDPRQNNFWVIVGGVWKLYTTTTTPLLTGGTSATLAFTLPPLVTTTIAVLSNGQTLPAPLGIINVVSTAGFNANGGEIL